MAVPNTTDELIVSDSGFEPEIGRLREIQTELPGAIQRTAAAEGEALRNFIRRRKLERRPRAALMTLMERKSQSSRCPLLFRLKKMRKRLAHCLAALIFSVL
jgi:hypothetical protein